MNIVKTRHTAKRVQAIFFTFTLTCIGHAEVARAKVLMFEIFVLKTRSINTFASCAISFSEITTCQGGGMMKGEGERMKEREREKGCQKERGSNGCGHTEQH